MIVYLTIADVASVQQHGSVWTITGSADDGKPVTFGGDWRLMDELVTALRKCDDDTIDVEIESWQIMAPAFEVVAEAVVTDEG